MLISGDRHMAEVSKVTVPGLGYDLFDITSSSLTHVLPPHTEPNRHRVGEMVSKINYGLITIDWPTKTATVRINGDAGATYLTQKVF